MEINLRDEAAIEEKRKDKIPYEHYKSLLKDNDPQEISKLSTCPYDEAAKTFLVTVMGAPYQVAYPQGDVTDSDGQDFDNYKLKTMILRYLINAKGVPATGQTIAYRDVSGGNVYYWFILSQNRRYVKREDMQKSSLQRKLLFCV